MKTQDFTYLLKYPQKINKLQTEQLENIIIDFPYFQSARALYLKGLKNDESYKYNEMLKTTAAYTSDRSILFDFITSSSFSNDTIVVKSPEQTIINEIEVIDAEFVRVLHQKIKDSFNTKKETNPIEVLDIGKPIDFENSESHSFNEWLQLDSLKPINRDSMTTSRSQRTIKFDLIDKFIALNPKISPIRKGETSSIFSEREITDNSNLMTETLAKVYLEQKKYENAIKAYRILSLKYPEKSSFFANRIKAIKLLDKK